MIEVSDLRFRERLAERRHAVLPPLFPDHREPFDVGEVFDGELGVLPHRAGFPSVEAGHIEQHAQLSVLPGESFELRHNVLVIRPCQLAADVNGEYLAAMFFIELNGHLDSFDSIQVRTIPARAGCQFDATMHRYNPLQTDRSLGIPMGWSIKLRIRCGGRNGLFRLRGQFHLCVAALLEPCQCGVFARNVEVLHLRMNEMVCNVRHDIRESTIRDDCNFLDSLMMLFQEF